MAGLRPEDFGLSEELIEEIHARDRKQAQLFVDPLVRGVGVVFLLLAAPELAVFRAVLGSDVVVDRVDHILAGARRCAYRVMPAA